MSAATETPNASRALGPFRDRGVAVADECLVEPLDLRVGGEELTYVAHLIQSAGHEDFFRVVAWSARRRFTHLEDEMRRALDSFRVLP